VSTAYPLAHGRGLHPPARPDLAGHRPRRPRPDHRQAPQRYRHRPHQTGAQALRARLLNQVNEGRRPATDATVAQLLGRWLEVADLAWSTRVTYQGYVDRTILPALGHVQLRRLDTATLDRFYTILRARGGSAGGPLAPATVRQVHAILRRALDQAARWGWIPANPAALASPPRLGPADLRPPTPEEVSRLLAVTYAADPDFAVLLWLAATTGARRGELCALRWPSVDLDVAELVVARNLIVRGGRLVEKDTKTHAARRIALSDDSIALLEEHRRRCAERAQACGAQLAPDAHVFSFDPAGRQPMNPDSVTHRFGRLAKQLGLRARLHDLRHYAATQLIAGGVDVRTVSGRIGHAGGGATTLKVYTHFQAAPDRRAAELLEQTLNRPTQGHTGGG
jgi:integrase